MSRAQQMPLKIFHVCQKKGSDHKQTICDEQSRDLSAQTEYKSTRSQVNDHVRQKLALLPSVLSKSNRRLRWDIVKKSRKSIHRLLRESQ